MPAPLSVIIPTLNAAADLPGTADALLAGATGGLIRELVISDGGSTDATLTAAREIGAVVVTGPPGRGGQIARGVAAASGDWLLVLHADTRPAPGWTGAVRAHIAAHPGRAGWFRLRFRAPGVMARLVAGGANLRARLLGLPYGDQGLLISRSLLESLGGYPDLPLMEDVALARKLRGRLRCLGPMAETSAEAYLRNGWVRRAAFNLTTLARYLLGTPPETLARRYADQKPPTGPG